MRKKQRPDLRSPDTRTAWNTRNTWSPPLPLRPTPHAPRPAHLLRYRAIGSADFCLRSLRNPEKLKPGSPPGVVACLGVEGPSRLSLGVGVEVPPTRMEGGGVCGLELEGVEMAVAVADEVPTPAAGPSRRGVVVMRFSAPLGFASLPRPCGPSIWVRIGGRAFSAPTREGEAPLIPIPIPPADLPAPPAGGVANGSNSETSTSTFTLGIGATAGTGVADELGVDVGRSFAGGFGGGAPGGSGDV